MAQVPPESVTFLRSRLGDLKRDQEKSWLRVKALWRLGKVLSGYPLNVFWRKLPLYFETLMADLERILKPGPVASITLGLCTVNCMRQVLIPRI